MTRQIKAKLPRSEILIFTIFDEEDKVLEAVKAGRLDATVFQDAVGQGRGAIDAAQPPQAGASAAAPAASAASGSQKP